MLRGHGANSSLFSGVLGSGHLGQVRRTTQNLEVIQVRKDDNLLLIKGSIPGSEGDYVVIREAKKYPIAQARKDREDAAKAAKAHAEAVAKGKKEAATKKK